jgi:hypothetical protein
MMDLRSGKEYWDEAKDKLGYAWMDTLVEAPGTSTDFVLNNEHYNRCYDLSRKVASNTQRKMDR